ncbi:MAG: HAD family hydrolase [bacterium]|nr:HAD family hydrolase [bacterium]
MRVVFLDRDGVLNQPIIRDGKPHPPAGVADVRLVPAVADSLNRLKQAGYLLIVVTNQPDVARGARTAASVEEIHEHLRKTLPLDDIRVCYHDDADVCDCRKPKPGMLLDAAAKHGINLRESFLIGDRWRDIDAGAAAGCRTILINYSYRERQPETEPDATVDSLAEAVRWIIDRTTE